MSGKRLVFAAVTLVMAAVWLGACGDRTTAPEPTLTLTHPTATPPLTHTPTLLPTLTPTPPPTLTPTPTNTPLPTSTPSENITDYTVSNPGNVLIDPDLRRQYLETLGPTWQNKLCIADPYPWQPGGEVFQVVELEPVIYFARGLEDEEATLWKLQKAMMVLAAEYLGTNNDEAAIAIIDTLRIWASANALSSLGGDTITTFYEVKWVITPTLAAYSLIRDHPNLSAEDQKLIENWLEMLVRQTDVALMTNNTSYMRHAINMEWGALMGDDAYFQKGVEGYISALGQMRPDGSFPLETARGDSAMHYTSHAINSLVLMAEIAANQGHNLYDLEQNNLSLHSAITFLLDTIDDPEIIVDYAAENVGCAGCGDYRNQLLVLYMDWIEPYRVRFPESENTSRINQMLEEGVLDYDRWKWGDEIVMIYPSPLFGVVTRCFYSRINIPTSRPTPLPLPDLPPGSFESGYIVYEDVLASGWSLDPSGGSADLNASGTVYQGANAIEVTLEPDLWITFDVASPPDVSASTWLVFYLNGGETANQQLYVEMKSGDNVSLGRVNLVGYIQDHPLQPGQWHLVMVPLSLLNPESIPFAWFNIGDASGDGASTFYIDEIRFVDSGP